MTPCSTRHVVLATAFGLVLAMGLLVANQKPCLIYGQEQRARSGGPGVRDSLQPRSPPSPQPIYFVNKQKSHTGLLDALRQQSHSINLAEARVDQMSTEELLLTVHSVLDNTDTICARKLRMGILDDGGWEICDDADVAPQAPCTVYSFGINYKYSFDDDTAKVYGCHVMSFDPSMNETDYDRSALVHFKRVGLAGRDKVVKKKNLDWPLLTFNSIKERYNQTDTAIPLVKMDIESSEWEALPEMISSGAFTGVRQLLVEYHVVGNSRSYLLPRVKAIQAVERWGFKKFYVHKNFRCGTKVKGVPVARTMCYEVHYVYRP